MNVSELRKRVTDFCHKRIQQKQLPNWWRDPLLVTSKADGRFDVLPEIAAENHMLPSDLLETCKTVVVFFIPFSAEVADGNAAGKFASEDWGLSLALTNELIQDISEFIRDYFATYGYKSALTPATYNFDPETLTARWSHKHLAHIAGLGRFGINAQLITPSGCAGRLGSLVTEAELGDNPLVDEKELCLYKTGNECLSCMRSCPVQAVALKGIDRYRCAQRIEVNRKRFAAKDEFADDVEVCAKCIAGMPCSLHSPLSNETS
jgi:epoxyqueuosine reductase QueG